MLEKLWNYFKNILMAIAATPAGGGGGLSSEQNEKLESSATESYVNTENKKFELILNFSDPDQLTLVRNDTDAYIIDSVQGDPRNSQIATTPGYTIGNTVTAYSDLTITVNKIGLAKIIGHFV